MKMQELDGFKLGDTVTCGTDRHSLLWKIVFIHAPKIFVGRTLHLVDLGCIDTLQSSHRQHRVGMCRSNVSTSHLTRHVSKNNEEIAMSECDWPQEVRLAWCRGWFGRESAYMKNSEATGTADQFWPDDERIYVSATKLAERDKEIARLHERISEMEGERPYLIQGYRDQRDDAARLREAGRSLLTSLGEFVRQSMHANPEWRDGIAAIEEAIATTPAVIASREESKNKKGS